MPNNYQVNYRINISATSATKSLNTFRKEVKSAVPKITKHLKKLGKDLAPLNKSLKLVNSSIKTMNKKKINVKHNFDSVTKKANKMNAAINGAQGKGKKGGFGKKSGGGFGTSALGAAGMPFAGMLGAGMVGMGIGGAITRAAKFLDQMQNVKAILMTTSKLAEGEFNVAFDEMSTRMRKLGEDTKFTATEIAGATKFLAKAGLNIAQIQTAMPTVADLAMIGDADISTMADQFTNMATSFGISMDDYGKFGDVLATVTNSANVDITQMSESFKFASSWATKLGITGNELAASIGILGDQGRHGTIAGTGLRAMMIRMVAPTRKAQKAIDKLGVSFTTVNKNGVKQLKPLADIFEELRDKGATVKDLKEIFEKVGSGAALALYSKVDRLRELTDISEKAGGMAGFLGEEKMKTVIGLTDQLASKFWNMTTTIFQNSEGGIKTFLETLITGMEWLGRNTGTITWALSAMGIALAGIGVKGMLAAGGMRAFATSTGGILTIAAALGAGLYLLNKWANGLTTIADKMAEIEARANKEAGEKLGKLEGLAAMAEKVGASRKDRIAFGTEINKVAEIELVNIKAKVIALKDLKTQHAIVRKIVDARLVRGETKDSLETAEKRLASLKGEKGKSEYTPMQKAKAYGEEWLLRPSRMLRGTYRTVDEERDKILSGYDTDNVKEEISKTEEAIKNYKAVIKQKDEYLGRVGTATKIKPDPVKIDGDTEGVDILNEISGAGALKGSGNKVVIVNIQNLIETLNADLVEGAADDDRATNLKDQMTKMLIDVTTDFQLGVTQ